MYFTFLRKIFFFLAKHSISKYSCYYMLIKKPITNMKDKIMLHLSDVERRELHSNADAVFVQV